ncbi:MAG: N-6 DNA methylase [Actinomycetota bacterium]
MADLFSGDTPLSDGYAAVYTSLGDLREAFHRSGRLDDSNAKLDEVAKLFATYLAYKRRLIPDFPAPHDARQIEKLQASFKLAANLPAYRISDGESIFGSSPALILRSGDEMLASELTELVRKSVDLAYELRSARKPFDILNEAFGHFVRDNFRGNIEDAQYMTPPEVVDFMVEIALGDMKKDARLTGGRTRHWTVLDPTCGVGSFLAAIYNRARDSSWLDPKHLRIFGQDKVERMVRLATLNLEAFEVEEHRITIGNSLAVGSPLDALNGTADLILTNPPFGARFRSNEVTTAFAGNTPFFSALRRPSASLDSELLFIDRNIRLLRDGGRLLIVVPDGVISARGMSALLRQHLANTVAVRAVIELPAVTFAQAGTRTKTAILYLQKAHAQSEKNDQVFMAVSRDLGFQVSSRKGVQVKVAEGQNDLPDVLSAYTNAVRPAGAIGPVVLSETPSIVLVPKTEIVTGSWTPNHYDAGSFKAVGLFRTNDAYTLMPLSDLVDFLSDSRRPKHHKNGWAFISVLHVLGEGLLDLRGALKYAPKTPGVEVNPGELLLSRINPRIPRVCVVPDLGTKILCSSEFEIMRPNADWDAYALAFLVQCGVVQDQIRSLTSGTSASHNRIRTTELARVRVPIPRKGTVQARKLANLARDYTDALRLMIENLGVLSRVRNSEEDLFKQ